LKIVPVEVSSTAQQTINVQVQLILIKEAAAISGQLNHSLMMEPGVNSQMSGIVNQLQANSKLDHPGVLACHLLTLINPNKSLQMVLLTTTMILPSLNRSLVKVLIHIKMLMSGLQIGAQPKSLNRILS
jgi:hypothetical protein